METNNYIIEIFSILFGTGGIIYAIVTHFLNKKKYVQEVREASVNADIKGDTFWKQRYDVLQKEVDSKDNWWKERYDALYKEYQNERTLSNDILKSFRDELAEIREDYERQKEAERQRYEELRVESIRKETEYKNRISQLEELVKGYEKRLS
jgi:hypothetical protein